MSNAAATSGALRLDWVSPLPPVRSGIADYSVDLLPWLQPLCDLRVARLPEQPVADDVVERWAPVSTSALGEAGRLPWYQMGNNVYHRDVRSLALQRPGVLTLHDVWLHHLLMECTLARRDLVGYVRALTADHGWVGGAVSLPPRWGAYGQAALFALPAHRALLERQRAVLVHSEWARSTLEEEIPGLGVRAVPMPLPVPELGPEIRIEAKELRQRLGIPLGAPLLGSFGFQTPIKRTEVAVRALAEPGLEKCWLLIGGDVARQLDLEGVARRAGVHDRVRITGFLSAEEFPLAISACDLCVNLRYPTAGETSASLLRILALGRCTLVSDFAQFDDLPDEVAPKVPLEAVAENGEAAALARRVRDLLGDRPRLRRAGEAARRYIEERHEPGRAATTMVGAIAELLEQPRSEPAPPRPARPSTLTFGWLPSRLEVEGAETPWPPGSQRRLRLTLVNSGFARFLPGSAPEGGVALQIQLLDGDGHDRYRGSWLPLPRSLGPGEDHSWTLELRRPLGPARLRIEPQVVDGAGFAALGGAVWEQSL
jgi:glycosyltransferase involved in cell wall biosynthesis